MTKQTFDPYESLALPDMLDQTKLKLVWHPHWERLKGTPLENDLPVLMVELIHGYLKRHTKRESVDDVYDEALQEAIALEIQNSLESEENYWQAAAHITKKFDVRRKP